MQLSQKQECIPVGCVPPACCPYLPACTAPRGCTWSEGDLVWGRGCTWSGGCIWSGGCTLSWGYTWSGGYLPRYSSLRTEWQTGVKILSCPKLHLRAVKIKYDAVFQVGWTFACKVILLCILTTTAYRRFRPCFRFPGLCVVILC